MFLAEKYHCSQNAVIKCQFCCHYNENVITWSVLTLRIDCIRTAVTSECHVLGMLLIAFNEHIYDAVRGPLCDFDE